MKKGLIIRIFLVLGIVLLLGIGVSYSLWNISASQDRVNTAMTSCFDITYSSESSAINLEKQYPISDEAGSKLTPYTFKITNNCDINAYYKINLETLNTSNIDTKFMKASINNENPKIISNYDDTNTSLKEGKVANTLKSGYLPVGGSISFDLRVWIDYDTTVNDIKNDGTDKWVGKIVVVSSPVTEDEINKVCQSHGGDLIEGGECRKYYVKLNNFVDFKNIEFGYVPSDNLPINHVYDGNAKKWTISYQGKNKWFGIHVYDVAKNFNHSFYGKYNLNYSKCFQTNQFCGIKDGCFYSGASIKNLEGNNYSFYYRLLNYLELNKITSFSEYFLYISFESSDNLSPEYTLSDYEVIDLTLMFGEGNEPSKEWCDKNLTNYYEYNIEGTLVPIKEIGEPVRTSYYDVINLF